MWQIIAAELSKRQLHDEGSSNNNNLASAFFTPKECECKYDELLMRFKRINCGSGGGGGGDYLTRMVSELTRLRIQELKFLVRKQDLSIKKCELNVKKLENKTTKPEIDSVGVKGKSRKRKGVNVVSPAATEKKRNCKRLNMEEEKSNVDRKRRRKTDTDVTDKRLVRPEKEVKKKTVVRFGASNESRLLCGLMAVAPATARTPDSTKSRQVSRRSEA